MSRILPVLLLILSGGGVLAGAQALPEGWDALLLSGRKFRVIDGDTFDADLNGDGRLAKTRERIRLLYVDTPELSKSRKGKDVGLGKPAKAFLTEVLEGRRIRLWVNPDYSRGNYGRLLGVLEADGRNVNLDDVERFLVREAPTYFGDYLRFTIGTEYDEWQGYAGNLKDVSSDVPPRKLYEGDLDDPVRAREFTTAGYNASLPLAHRLAKRFDFSRFNHWLDFAGGSGCYAIAACERHDGLRVTIRDHPNVVPVAEEFIAKHELQNRIAAQPGDFLAADDYAGDFDLISYITPLHWYLRDDVVKALRLAHDALPPSGGLLIVGYMLNDERSGPVDPAFYHLQAIREGHYTGHVPSGLEYVSYLEAAGFTDAKYEWLLPNRLGQIEARKPA